MEIPLLAFIFQGIPEHIAFVTFSFALAKITLKWSKIISFGVILAFITYFIRMLSPTFGVHTIIVMGMLFIFLVQTCDVTIITALRTALLAVLTLIITETTSLYLLTRLFDKSYEMLNENIVERIVLTWPQILILFLLSFIIITWRRRKGKANESFRNKSAHLR
ncbi:MAG: hypothetical protein ACOX3R_12360 [Desulfitobacteriia bacterium]